MTEAGDADVGAGFAALMSKAAVSAKPPVDPEAPYGYTVKGEPKKGPGGRPRKSPSLDDLKASAEAEGAGGSTPPSDRAPAAPKGRRRRRGSQEESRPAPPMPKQGVIAAGMNRLYRTAGRVLQAMSQPGSRGALAGAALVEITRAAYEDDVTVGEAWERFAAQNPRVRAFLLRILSGGAAGELVWCHIPVLLAVISSPDGDLGPLARVAGAMMAPDEPGGGEAGQAASEASNGSSPFGALSQEDIQAAMAFAQNMAGRAAEGPPRGM